MSVSAGNLILLTISEALITRECVSKASNKVGKARMVFKTLKYFRPSHNWSRNLDSLYTAS